jgi:transposase
MTISELTLQSSMDEPVRRFEVFTGVGRRRDWSMEAKSRIVAESFEPGASVSAVARRHALSPQQLFAWRRAVRRGAGSAPLFVPAVMVPDTETERAGSDATKTGRGRGRPRRVPLVEVELGGARVRVESGAAPDTIAAVIDALKTRA